MNEKIKAKNLEKAIEEINKLSKSDLCHIKTIITPKEKYFIIRTNLTHWQFWYDPKNKVIEMERI